MRIILFLFTILLSFTVHADTVRTAINNTDWVEVQEGTAGVITNNSPQDIVLRHTAIKPDASVTSGHEIHPSEDLQYTLQTGEKIFARSRRMAKAYVAVTEDAFVPGFDSRVSAEFLKSFETSNTGTTGLGVFIQDQTTEVIDLKLHKNLNTFTLASNTVLDTFTITASPGHGIIIGNSICFLEGQFFSQFDVTNVVGDVITFDSPMDKIYTPAATSIHHTFDMRTGTASPGSPEIWRIAPIPGQRWDIVRIILVMESTANNMDFTGFGNLAALTNGAILRTKDGVRQNLFNWKTNGDFINRSFDHSFQGKTGGGGSGFVARSTFGGQSKRGVVLRLDGNLGQELQVVIQDPTDGAGLTKFFVIAQGHVVQ